MEIRIVVGKSESLKGNQDSRKEIRITRWEIRKPGRKREFLPGIFKK
jgi:hypothetical protein